MGLISITNPADGEAVDASDVSTPFNTFKDVINGNLDNDNIAAGAGILFTKLAATAWSSFVPTWTGLTLGNGTSAGTYQQLGKWVVFKGKLTCGSTTNTTGTGNPIYCDLPVNAAAATDYGSGLISDSGGGNHLPVIAVVSAATTLNFYAGGTQAVAGGYPTGYFTAGSGNSTSDTIAWTIVYQAA